jgi:hypothetical protein
MKIKEAREYIAFDISEYLLEAGEIMSGDIRFNFIQMIDLVLPSVFLKMTGCLEHKLDMVWLQVCLDNEKERQEMMRNKSKIPEGSSLCKEILNKLDEQYKKLFRMSLGNLWGQSATLSDVTSNLKNLFEETGLSQYLATDKQVFYKFSDAISTIKNQVTKLGNHTLSSNDKTKILESIRDIIETYREYNILTEEEWNQFNNNQKLFSKTNTSNDEKQKLNKLFSEIKPYIKKRKKFVSQGLLDKAFLYRNKFAHNETSIYCDTPSPLELMSDEQIYNSWYFRFLGILYLDAVVRDRFEKYCKAKDKLKC